MGVSQLGCVLSQYHSDIQIIIPSNSGYVLYAVHQFVQCLTNPGEKGEGMGMRDVTFQM